MAKVHCDLGCSQRTKGAEDRYFALLEMRLTLAETSRKICSSDHVLGIWRKAAAAACVPSRFKEYFIDLLPQVSKEQLLQEAPPLLPDLDVCVTYSWGMFPGMVVGFTYPWGCFPGIMLYM